MKEESQARVARISGAGHLPGGEYESIHISGSAQIDGDAVCQGDVHVSGAASAKGDLAAKEIHVSGSMQVEGDAWAEAVRISGSAHVAAEAVDSLHWPEVLGTVAGDNTILIIVRSNDEVDAVIRRFKNIVR